MVNIKTIKLNKIMSVIAFNRFIQIYAESHDTDISDTVYDLYGDYDKQLKNLMTFKDATVLSIESCTLDGIVITIKG